MSRAGTTFTEVKAGFGTRTGVPSAGMNLGVVTASGGTFPGVVLGVVLSILKLAFSFLRLIIHYELIRPYADHRGKSFGGSLSGAGVAICHYQNRILYVVFNVCFSLYGSRDSNLGLWRSVDRGGARGRTLG
jgi:hypothetical protein